MLKGVLKLSGLVLNPASRTAVKAALADVYRKQVSVRSGIAPMEIDELVDFPRHSFHLTNLEYETGHTTRMELLYVLAIIKDRLTPGNHFLEIGTFNGNTALNIARNLPEGSRLFTMDLPYNDDAESREQLQGDQTLIASERRKSKKHLNCPNVQQIYSDSREFDFSSIEFQGAFIDGGHAYGIVKSDSENVIKQIRRPGFVLWHDYDGLNEVSAWLHDLRKEFPMVRINGTALCFLELK